MASKTFLTQVGDDIAADVKQTAQRKLVAMLDPYQYIGDLIALDYGHADILVHDTHRNRTNGLPHGCLLIATRITPADLTNNTLPEDSSLLLIRVAESVKLSTDTDLDKVRFEAVQRSNRLLKKGVQVGNIRFRSLTPWSCWRKLCRSHGTFSPFGFADRPFGGAGHS